MLKTFIVQQSVASIEVEECYQNWVKELRTDKYVTAGVSYLLVAGFSWSLGSSLV